VKCLLNATERKRTLERRQQQQQQQQVETESKQHHYISWIVKIIKIINAQHNIITKTKRTIQTYHFLMVLHDMMVMDQDLIHVYQLEYDVMMVISTFIFDLFLVDDYIGFYYYFFWQFFFGVHQPTNKKLKD
jgi:hypothetical protein